LNHKTKVAEEKKNNKRRTAWAELEPEMRLPVGLPGEGDLDPLHEPPEYPIVDVLRTPAGIGWKVEKDNGNGRILR